MDAAGKLYFAVLASSVIFCFVLSQDYPTYSEIDLPVTSFTCEDKVHGGYYADMETDCQMYHVCHRDKHGNTESTKFLCGNGTLFDQRHLVCQDYWKVHRCHESEKYYRNVPSWLERVEERRRHGKSKEDMLEYPFEGDFPTYSESDLPVTRFSCQDKVHGGYYADIETDCQMYHICARDKDGRMRSNKFLCGNGTVFDQRHLVCQDYHKVRGCQESRKYYRNMATLLELLEDRLGNEQREKAVLDAANFPFKRLD